MSGTGEAQYLSRTAVEAVSWALAVELVAALGSEFTRIEAHPGGGTYDDLWIFRGQCLAEGAVSGPRVHLNRNGSLHVV